MNVVAFDQDQEWGCLCPKTGRLVSVGFAAPRSLLRKYDSLTLCMYCDDCKEKHSALIGDLLPVLATQKLA